MVLNEQLKDKHVLVIGDSFTKIFTGSYSWLNRLRVHYNWSIDDRSIDGSGSHYAFNEFLNNKEDFDICIFAWSEPSRLFVPGIPDLNSSEAQRKTKMQEWQKDIYRAAQHYYMHLMNHEMEVRKNVAMLYWLDDYLKENFNDKMFLHFHSFPKPSTNDSVYEWIKITDKPSLYHTFKTGINITPTLLKLSVEDPSAPNDYAFDERLGHLSKELHEKLFYQLTRYFKKYSYNDINILDVGNIND